MLTPIRLQAVLRLAVVAILLAVLTHTRADPDLFGNLRFGQDVVVTQSAQVDDTYSFTGERQFTNHEWLFQAVAFLFFRYGGAPALIVLKLLILAAMMVAVARALTSSGVAASTQLLLAVIVVIGTFPQTNHVRAQLCSLALFAWLLVALARSRDRLAAYAWLVPLMIVWANVHGGWIVGAGVVGAWCGVGLIADSRRRHAVAGLVAGAVAIAGTVVNPYGWHLWTFLRETVGFGRADIADWQPVFRLGIAYGLLWTMVAGLALAGAATAVRRRAFDPQAACVVTMLAVASFRVNRLLAFFTIAVVMLFAADLAVLLERSARPRRERQPSRLAAGTAAAIALALLLGGGTMAAGNLSCIRMEAATFPEPEVASLVARYGLHGRMINWFDYGHYAIWYFSPAIKVSMDGRRETAYSSEMIQRQLRFYYRPEERHAVLAELRPDYIWLPRHLAVVDPLIADGWKAVFEGPQSVMLARAGIADGPIAMTPASRCFPGP